MVVTTFPKSSQLVTRPSSKRRIPDLRVQFVWKQSRDALALLSQPDQGGVDVYWAPSLGNFPILATAAPSARWRSIAPLCRAGSAASRSPTRRACSRPMTSPAMGSSIDPAALARSRRHTVPRRWSDLAAPALRRSHRHAARRQGRLLAGALRHHPAGRGVGARLGAALPRSPATRSSRAPVPARPAAVKEGRAALGLTIDFLALGAQANGAERRLRLSRAHRLSARPYRGHSGDAPSRGGARLRRFRALDQGAEAADGGRQQPPSGGGRRLCRQGRANHRSLRSARGLLLSL